MLQHQMVGRGEWHLVGSTEMPTAGMVAKDQFQNSAAVKLFARRFQVSSMVLILPAASVASAISNITSALLRGAAGAKKPCCSICFIFSAAQILFLWRSMRSSNLLLQSSASSPAAQ